VKLQFWSEKQTLEEVFILLLQETLIYITNWTGVRNGQRRMDYVRYWRFFCDVYFRNKMKILNHIKDDFNLVLKNLYSL